MKIYVGSLAQDVMDEDLRALFSSHGQVLSASVIMDRYSGSSKGFGFVEMPNDAEGQAAINALNGKELKGRTIAVSLARPRTDGGQPRRGGESRYGGRDSGRR